MCSNPCNRCGQCDCAGSCQFNNEGCLDIIDTSCISYDGLGLNCINVTKDTDLNDLLDAVNDTLCSLLSNSGKVSTNSLDTCPGFLIDKVLAGANISISGVGTGCDAKIRIDAVLGGQIVDEKVKASATDAISNYLDGKIIGGDCINITKVNVGFDEKLKINVDWNCVLTKLMSLSGFCTAVNGCTGNTVISCPSISLNSPNITGSSVTLSWVSPGTQFNVYFDGVIEPGMPTSATSFTKSGLADGMHIIQVYALCAGGTPNSASTNFIINTTCPTASGLNVNISGGTASLSWTPAVGINVSNQTVQYKLQSAVSWTNASTVTTSTSSTTISGLGANSVYQFRIVTNCSVGGPTPSSSYAIVELTCPVLTLTPSNTSIQYQFSSVGGDVNQYVVQLLNASGSTILQTNNENSPFASTITNTFSGLTAGTNYQIKVTVVAGTFNRPCTAQAISTTTPPSCPPPSGMSVSLS